jgi:hypothetical protein
MPADKVGCVTLQASAARAKCFSRAKARRNSSLSIKIGPQPKASRPGATKTPPCEMLSQLMENPVVSQYF